MQANRTYLWILTGIPVAWGIVEAFRSAWLCDDVFITFRYVDNFARGHGLVFNEGECVEGYTHFLWMLILSAGQRLGFALVDLGRYLPIAAFAATLALLLWRSRMARKAGLWGLPIAAWGFALHHDAQLYASSGLETAFYTFLSTAGLLFLGPRQPRLGTAGVCFGLATLTRPEGALFTLLAGVYIVARWRKWSVVLRFSGIWLMLVLPMLVFRQLYYGQWVPNTFYAKSADTAYWSQGWHYTRLYFEVYPVLLLGFVALLVVWLTCLARKRDILEREGVATLAGMMLLAHLLYVVRVGGDFMFARFLIPVTPLLYLLIEEFVRLGGKRWLEIGLAVVVLGGTLYARTTVASRFPGRERVHGITNEANYYTDELVEKMKRQGEILGRVLQGTDARIGLLSGQDAVAYFGRLPYALEPHGLTDARLSKQPLTSRGRPGHEKVASYEDMVRRGVSLRLRYGWTVNLPIYKQVRFDDLYGEMIYYDNKVMSQLRGRPGVNFLHFPDYLDGYLNKVDGNLPRRLLNDYVDFQLFYFIHNEDPSRLQRLRRTLIAAGIPNDALEQADEQVEAVRGRLQP